MPRVTCDQDRTDGVTLVTCRLASDATRRVTLEPTHDPPIWPPRRQGVPAAGWEGDTWTGIVEADRTRGLGYATPVDPADEPVRVVDVEPPDEPDDSISAREVVRSLGDPSPVRDTVPTADATDGRTQAAGDSQQHAGGGPPDATTQQPREDASGPRPEAARNPDEPSGGAARLDAIDRRLDTASDLASVSTPEEARSAVANVGGLIAVRSLVEHLEADRAYLERVGGRTDDLAARAEATTVPLAALERLT